MVGRTGEPEKVRNSNVKMTENCRISGQRLINLFTTRGHREDTTHCWQFHNPKLCREEVLGRPNRLAYIPFELSTSYDSLRGCTSIGITDEGLAKYANEMGSSVMMCVPSSIYVGSGIQAILLRQEFERLLTGGIHDVRR
jgi:hypothetical protein